jgi:glycerate dehydrogenase
MHAVFLDWESVDNQDLDRQCLQSLPVSWQFHATTSAEQVLDRLSSQQIVVSNKVMLDANTIAAARAMQLICVAATGTNNVDLPAASARNIPVCNVRTYATPSVVQHVFMLILNLLRHLPQYEQALRDGRWQQSEHFCFLDYTIEELSGKTLGIVGFGELGQAVAHMAEQFGMQVLVAQRPQGAPQAGRLSLPDLLARVDVLSLHCPLTQETRGLIGAHELSLMKPSAILINTARGGIVDERALLAALANGKLAGAGIDVLHSEPPRQGNPLLQTRLPNLIVTPHIAWASRQARQRLIEGVAQNIRAYLNGQPQNRVN